MSDLIQRLRRALNIDLQQLEKEWCDQPLLYFDVARDQEEAEAAAERAKVELDLAREEVKAVDARLDGAIRSDPEAFGIAKATEAAIANAVLVHAHHATAVAERNTAQDKWIEAKRKAGTLKAACQAFDHRKHALQKCVDMLLAGFFAAPKRPKDEGERVRREVRSVGKRESREGRNIEG